jgi:hypothetical protein
MGVVATMDAASQNATSKTVGSVSFCDGCVTKRPTQVVTGWGARFPRFFFSLRQLSLRHAWPMNKIKIEGGSKSLPVIA